MALVLALLALLLAAPLAAEAQTPAKVYRVGVLANALATSDGPTFQAFLEALHGLGYEQQRNMQIEWRSSEGESEQLPALAAELVRARVDVILATALMPAQAAVEATRTVPVVFVVLADPVAQRLVQSLARPGGNATGVAAYAPQESADRTLQILRALVPKLARLGVVTNPSHPIQRELLAGALATATRRANVALTPLPVQGPGDLPGIFARARQESADAIQVLPDIVTYIHRARVAELAARHRIPAIYASRSAVEAGGLVSYGPNLREHFRKAASYVDKILKGTAPGDLPVEQSTRGELAINRRAARELGLSVPPALLRQAAYVQE